MYYCCVVCLPLPQEGGRSISEASVCLPSPQCCASLMSKFTRANKTARLERDWRLRMGFVCKSSRRARDRHTLTGLCSERLGGQCPAGVSRLLFKLSLPVVTEERAKGVQRGEESFLLPSLFLCVFSSKLWFASGSSSGFGWGDSNLVVSPSAVRLLERFA